VKILSNILKPVRLRKRLFFELMWELTLGIYHIHRWKSYGYISTQRALKVLGYYETAKEAAIAFDVFIVENNLPNKKNFN